MGPVSIPLPALAAALLFLLAGCADKPAPTGPAAPVGPDGIHLSGDSLFFMAGINYPWLYYGHDFGQASGKESAWSHDGMSLPASALRADSQFAALHSNRVEFVRCFLFCDGRASPEFDSNGYVLGFDSLCYADIDTFLRIAERHSIRIIATLLDYLWLDTGIVVGDVPFRGRSAVITDSLKRQSFMDSCLGPFMSRYGASPQIATWDIMNEPEWFVLEQGGAGRQSAVSRAQIRRFFGECVQCIKAYSTIPVTLGCADAQWLQDWTGLGLDFYEVHSYSNSGGAPPFLAKADLGLDRSVLLGEFPTNVTSASFVEYLNAAWNNGYAGAFGWSLNGQDASSGFSLPDISNAYASWVEARDIRLAKVVATVDLTGQASGTKE
ncbi:MAG: hypothetical protein V1913_05840 [Fibrobacterota bacterium]